jgi:GT2 family glycosyltransferase
MSLDIIIPVFNQSAYTDSVLQCVAANNHTPERVVVINNGSTDNTEEILANYSGDLNLVVINNSYNLGVNYAWWQGVLASKADYLGILNNDIQFSHTLFDCMLDILESDNHIGVIGPFEKATIEEAMLQSRQRVYITSPASIRLHGHPGCAMFLERIKMFDVVGEFPEGLVIGYGDVFITERLRLAGYTNLIINNVKIYHRGSVTVRDTPHNYSEEKLLFDRYMRSGTRTLADLEEFESKYRTYMENADWHLFGPFVAFYEWVVSACGGPIKSMCLIGKSPSAEGIIVNSSFNNDIRIDRFDSWPCEFGGNYDLVHVDIDPHSYDQTKDILEVVTGTARAIILHDAGDDTFGVRRAVYDVDDNSFTKHFCDANPAVRLAAPAALIRR